MRISQELFDQMVEHARTEAPNECCGMIGSRDGEVVSVHAAVNIAASALKYEISPEELYQIQKRIDDDDLDLGAIYHSHTRSDPYPSQTDINLAFYPDSLYVIVGLKGPEPDVRAYEIREGRVSEAELHVG